MRLIAVYAFVLLLVVGAGTAENSRYSSMLFASQEISAKKCMYKTAYSMFQAVCPDLHWEKIPQNLKTNIQVLNATENRLRKLDNTTFALYKKLMYIYLRDNFLQVIDENTFAELYYLEVLDLAKNGFKNLPKSLFQLPHLRKVYLENNQLEDSTFNVEITSPVDFLQLSENNFSKIPQIGLVPSLLYLNLSENSISVISTEDLAPFCSLQILDLSKNPIRFNTSGCECQKFNAWLRLRKITFKPGYNCTADEIQRCPNPTFSNRTNELYANCREVLRIQIETQKARTRWIVVASSISVFIAVVFITFYCIHRKNKRKRRKQKTQRRLNATIANAELLKNNIQNDNSV